MCIASRRRSFRCEPAEGPQDRRAKVTPSNAVLFVATLLCWLGLSPSLGHAEAGFFTVRPGDALSLLADRFGVTVDELRSWNQLDNDRIFVGQRLRVQETPTPGSTYRVRRGETLSEIAARFNLSVQDIVNWNEGMEPDRVREGQELQLGQARHRIEYRVRSGDTLSRIAGRHEVRVGQLLGWNPRLNRNVIRQGQRIVIYSDIPASTSESVGWPYHGRLRRGVRLRPHPGYVIRNRSRAYGTHETVRWIVEGFRAVRREHPEAPRVRVHDISRPRGGPMAGHRSHQSGRDADISFFLRRGCSREEGCRMLRAAPHDLVLDAQWSLLRHWLERDQVEAIFIDYSLAEALYEEAKTQGASRSELASWFQYPRGRDVPVGIIRHYPQHRDHLHVRFRCHDTDPECR